MGKKKRRWPWVLAGVLLLSFTVWYIRVQYYGLMNCGASAEDMTRYVEQMVKGKDIFDLKIAVRKTARGGRMQAILYEEYRDSDPDWKYGYVIFFERQLFGLRSIKNDTQLDLVVNFEQWDNTKFYDRLGIEDHFVDILDVRVPCVTLPVRPGRNLASIVEVAAMNNRQRRLGFNAAEELARRVDQRADLGSGKIG